MQITKGEENKFNLSNPYHMLKFSIRSELTRKYYERRIRNFFEFIEFCPDKDMEERCNSFANAMLNDSSWGLNKIITFLQYQKERTEKGDITAATLINFVKALKLFWQGRDPFLRGTDGLGFFVTTVDFGCGDEPKKGL